ncbi:MAG: hypothetical protein KTR21_09680 [Rhodobacteraceae bacterium]|nr:hypothetical protein [Paracoccaceae bacterium]
MQWWSRYQQKRAAKRFGGRLHTALRRRYGARDHFTEPQIRRTVEDMRMPRKHMNLWLAGFMAEGDLSLGAAERPEWREVEVLRREVWFVPSDGGPSNSALIAFATSGGGEASASGDAGGAC